MQTGEIFDIKKYAIHDGPGIRTTVFFKGCPLSCWWCHNPESLSMTPHRLYRPERCIGCRECLTACPNDAILEFEGKLQWTAADCRYCETCAHVCPAEAVEFIGRSMTLDEVVAEITKDTLFYDQSSGGVTISGGEPLLYKSQGKDIFDCLATAHMDYHLMYTNGVLIDRDAAKRMADLGNVTPAISVEGWEKETNARRGKGVYDKILRAMDNLRAEGVPFGISLTAMRHNAELLMSDDFLDFWFDQQGAIYAWMFQYMPIGRGITIEDMITSDQRRWMLDRLLKILYDDGRFVIDFWNGGPLSEGCIAAGRQGGYFYLDWNGDITPCVFFPYAAANIKDLYAEGKDLSAVMDTGLFRGIRDWQEEYYGKKDGTKPQNLFMPCPMRDHHDVAHTCALEHEARPTGPEAAVALQDQDYLDGMRRYGEELQVKLAPYWGDGGDKVRGDLYGLEAVPPARNELDPVTEINPSEEKKAEA